MRISGLTSAVVVAVLLGMAALGLAVKYVLEAPTPPIVYALGGEGPLPAEDGMIAVAASAEAVAPHGPSTANCSCPVVPETRSVADEALPASDQTSILVDINNATPQELMQLPGIGPAYAQRIIELRELRSGFVYKEELLDVPGIGPTRFAQLKDLVTVGPYAGITGGVGVE